jgi:hypothetical protein
MAISDDAVELAAVGVYFDASFKKSIDGYGKRPTGGNRGRRDTPTPHMGLFTTPPFVIVSNHHGTSIIFL